jgi:purine-nucleoside phosphorylase
MSQDAIVNPVKGKKAPDLGNNVLLVSTQSDLNLVRRLMALTDTRPKPLYNSQLFHVSDTDSPQAALAGPVTGAPYAVMLLETLVCWGAKYIVFWGWCGAISPGLKIGDIIIPTAAVVDEGTSKHYPQGAANSFDGQKILWSTPDDRLVATLVDQLKTYHLPCQLGSIWTTDAIYRETKTKVAQYQKDNILAVEMEMSALFTVARFRRVSLAGVLVVSDDLSSFSWRPGFRNDRFAERCRLVAQALTHLSRKPCWATPACSVKKEGEHGFC